MSPKLFSKLKSYTPAQKHDLKKLLLLCCCFFMAICSFSIIKPLKQSVFLAIVGADYQPYTRFVTLILLSPLMFFYSKLVDKLRRYKLVSGFMLIYAIGSLIFAYFLWHPAYGISNTVCSKWRILGWAFYAYGDFFPIFVVSAFWAFSNSISDPNYAKNNYGIMVAASQVAGIFTPLLGAYALSRPDLNNNLVIPALVALAALFLLGASATILLIKRMVPGHLLHGYEAVYQLEKQKGKKNIQTGIFEGIKLMLTQPYVFGIFGLLYSYEIISAIIDYQMQVLVKLQYNGDVAAMSSYMFFYTAAFQGVGLIFALLGTRSLLKSFDVRICLLLSPIIAAVTVVGLMIHPSLTTVTITMIILRAMNYGFNVPVREILYIPTVKDIKFKSKAWVDSFGRSFSKTSGSTFNILSLGSSVYSRIAMGSSFSLAITVMWALVAISVGKKYTSTIKDEKIIGSEEA